jgi:hypothetical protein
MRKMLRITMILVFAMGTVIAQDQSVSGRVSDAEDGSGLPGVNVLLKGTTTGAVTDVDGNFKVNVSSSDVVLVFSFIGYQTQEITVGNQSVINVSLNLDVTQLSEVVVVGYGTTIKQDLTGNIANVSGEDIAMQPITTVEQAIQGRTAGVLITSQNGKLGQGMDIRVRRASSIYASNQPL